MRQVNLEEFETEGNYNTCISEVSNILISETGKISRLKERYKYSGARTASKDQSDLYYQNLVGTLSESSKKITSKSTPSEESSHLDTSSLKLIATSTKHNVYHVEAENVLMKIFKTDDSSFQNLISAA